ncbi:MAG: S53 family peptidase [Candidatus Sulfotelmatobacter sp.]
MRNLRSSLCCSIASTLSSTICLTAICVITICAATLSFAEAPDRIAGAIDSSHRVVLKSQIQRRALPQFDQGRVEPSLQLHVTLLTVPSPSQVKALKQLLAEQQDAKSASFHKWLTPQQYADRFGLSHNDVQKTSAWLKSQGFSVDHVANGRNWIVFSGTASQIESALRTEIHRYNVNGKMHFSNAAPPSIPVALSGVAVGFRGLDDFRPRPSVRKALPRARNVRPDFYFNDANLAFPNFAAPGDIAKMYNFPSGIDGTGEKLVIVGQTDVYLADLNNFRSGFGQTAISGCTTNGSDVITSCTTSSTANFQYVLDLTTSSDPGVSLDDLSEADLDLEWSAATAPGAQIIFVNSDNVFTSYYYAIDHSPIYAPVISMSYGTCEFNDNFILDPTTGAPLADETELMKANSEGITFINSSGDSGAAECDPPFPPAVDVNNLANYGLAVSYPASSPEVTGVGGTSIPYTDLEAGSSFWSTTNTTDGQSVNSYIPEAAWNDDVELAAAFGNTALSWQESYAIVASGGGPSNCAKQSADNSTCVSGFPQPSWQSALTISGQTAVRFSPDVSLLASPNFPGYIYCTPVEELSQTAPYSGESTSSCGSGGTAGITTAISGVVSGNNFVVEPSLVGGTSASAPIFAGIVTMLNQYLVTNGFQSTPGLGNINPTLYTLAATPANGAFHPVKSGSNIVYCAGDTPTDMPANSTYLCPGVAGTTDSFGFNAATADGTTGYNLVTGLGSVDANALFTAWNASTTTPPPNFTLGVGVNSLQVTPGQTGTATITVTGTHPALTFTCTETTALSSSGSVCTITPSIPTSADSASLTISTIAPTAQMRRPLGTGRGIFFAALLPGLFGIVFTAGSRKRAARGLRFLSLIVVLGFSTLWLASCSSSNSSSTSNPGTPAGSYVVTVNATAGGTTASTTVTLVVQ